MSNTKIQSRESRGHVKWYAFYSEKEGREYYYNPTIRVATWILPDGDHPYGAEMKYAKQLFNDPAQTCVSFHGLAAENKRAEKVSIATRYLLPQQSIVELERSRDANKTASKFKAKNGIYVIICIGIVSLGVAIHYSWSGIALDFRVNGRHQTGSIIPLLDQLTEISPKVSAQSPTVIDIENLEVRDTTNVSRCGQDSATPSTRNSASEKILSNKEKTNLQKFDNPESLNSKDNTHASVENVNLDTKTICVQFEIEVPTQIHNSFEGVINEGILLDSVPAQSATIASISEGFIVNNSTEPGRLAKGCLIPFAHVFSRKCRDAARNKPLFDVDGLIDSMLQ